MKKLIYKTLPVFFALLLLGAFFLPKNQPAYAMDSVYLGGIPVGIKAKGEYFVITEFIDVITKEGSYSPAQKAGIQKGDIILSVNEQKPTSVGDINKIVQNSREIFITVSRGDNRLDFTVFPALDAVKNEYKLGILIRNDLGGIGTLTYVTQEGKFGALGHRIGDSYGYSDLYSQGDIFDCVIYGYKKAKENQAGELCGKIEENVIGRFYSNSESGLNGYFTDKKTMTEVPLGSKNDVKPGKAQIYTTVDGSSPVLYDIDIIKTYKQEKEAPKSMLIRITDQKLLSTTGGILQGMSGSPILQNGKLVGAVTHVMTNNSTLGYGIYIDWMITK